MGIRAAMAATALLLLEGLALPALAQAAAPAKAAAPAPAPALKDKCLGCHDDATMKAEDGKSVAVLAGEFARSAHRKIDCSVCHDAALTVI